MSRGDSSRQSARSSTVEVPLGRAVRSLDSTGHFSFDRRVRPWLIAVIAMLSLAPGCRSSNARIDCTSSRDCSSQRMVCAIERGYCVPCLVDADCLMADRACVASQCVTVRPCTSTVECPGRVCDTGAGRCVDCLGPSDCQAGEQCTPDGACVPPCMSDAICGSHGLVCDTASATCVECVRDADCGAGHGCSGNRCSASTTDGGTPPRDTGSTPSDTGAVDAASPMPDAGTGAYAPCATGADCALGFRCYRHSNGVQVCVRPCTAIGDDAPCAATPDATCHSDTTSLDGMPSTQNFYCLVACVTDADCGPYQCVVASGDPVCPPGRLR